MNWKYLNSGQLNRNTELSGVDYSRFGGGKCLPSLMCSFEILPGAPVWKSENPEYESEKPECVLFLEHDTRGERSGLVLALSG